MAMSRRSPKAAPKMATQLFAEDATIEDPVGTPLKRGHAEILPFYETAMASGARLELTGEPRCSGR